MELEDLDYVIAQRDRFSRKYKIYCGAGILPLVGSDRPQVSFRLRLAVH
ncbi:MAG: hypothetical protein KME17_14315 [Cyanosarcina radialis HA8281-LM2]|nr:hypothetical protein [Cyanosarcina radialis HA8281-LM2]